MLTTPANSRSSRSNQPDTPPVIAFYAPLKPPTHANPSGDRLLAQLFLQALRQAGFSPELASRFRSYDRHGDRQRQLRLKQIAERLAQRLIRRYQQLPVSQRPQLWLSYHLYHKAPDWIGPIVCRALSIPYVVAEASYAHKQQSGPWQLGLSASVEALQQAALILCLNPADRAGIEQCRTNPPLQPLAPFLDLTPFNKALATATTPQASRQRLAQQYSLDPALPWLICVAMMRPGDKLLSYRLLAQSLQLLSHSRWQLIIVGDGSARADVEAAFKPLADQTCFTGRLAADAIRPLLRASDLYLWPAVNEAFGMALLEAQAAGTAVLAGDEGGVSSVVNDAHSGWLVAPRDSSAFAAKLEQLLNPTQTLLINAGISARTQIEQRHSLAATGQRLRKLLLPLIDQQPNHH